MLKSLFLGVHPDEANWWMQSRHLSAGYYFHPPLAAFTVRAGTLVFGEEAVGLRTAHVFLATASLALIYLFCRELGSDGRWSFFTVLLVALLPFTSYWITMVVVDTPMIFFSLLFALFAWRALSRDDAMCWYWAGLAAGLMLLCKLQASFYLAGLTLLVLTTPPLRRWLRRKEPYLGLALCLTVMSPTLAWYAAHRFEPIIFQLTSRPGFLHSGPGDYLLKVVKHAGWEALALSPLVYLFSLFGLVYGGLRGFRERRLELLFPFWMALPGFLFFTLTGGPPRWGFSFHIYSLVLAMSAASLRASDRPLASPRFGKAAYGALFLLPCLFLSSLSLYLAAGSSLHTGWREVAEAVRAEAGEAMAADGKSPVVAAPYYFIPSEIAYHNRDVPLEYTIAFPVYENEVMCDDDRYSPWTPLRSLAGRDFLFVDERRNPDGYETPAAYWEEKLALYFREVRGPKLLRLRPPAGEERVFYIFFCRGFKGPDEGMGEKGEIRRYLETARESLHGSSFSRHAPLPAPLRGR